MAYFLGHPVCEIKKRSEAARFTEPGQINEMRYIKARC